MHALAHKRARQRLSDQKWRPMKQWPSPTGFQRPQQICVCAPHSGGVMAVGLRLVHSVTCTLLFGVRVQHVHRRCAGSIDGAKEQRDVGPTGNAARFRDFLGTKDIEWDPARPLWWVYVDLRVQNRGGSSAKQTAANQNQPPDQSASLATLGGTKIYICIYCVLNQEY